MSPLVVRISTCSPSSRSGCVDDQRVPGHDRRSTRTTPRATLPAPHARLRALARLRAVDIDAGLLVAPIVPLLTEWSCGAPRTVRAASAAGAVSWSALPPPGAARAAGSCRISCWSFRTGRTLPYRAHIRRHTSATRAYRNALSRPDCVGLSRGVSASRARRHMNGSVRCPCLRDVEHVAPLLITNRPHWWLAVRTLIVARTVSFRTPDFMDTMDRFCSPRVSSWLRRCSDGGGGPTSVPELSCSRWPRARFSGLPDDPPSDDRCSSSSATAASPHSGRSGAHRAVPRT
jgi:hypothetical protein